MADPIGRMVSEIRAGLLADGGSPAIVRGGRLFGGDSSHAADAPPVALIRSNSRSRWPRIGVSTWRLAVTSFGSDPKAAMDLDSRISDVLHAVGPRHTAGGVAIYRSAEEVGGQVGEDPDTGWSSVTSVYIVHGSAGTL